jgi:hypothetical protein
MDGMPSVSNSLIVSSIINVSVTEDTLSVDLEDGRSLAFPIGWYPSLAYGTKAERNNLQISSAGYGINWPDLDEDIGIEGLLLGLRSSESHASFERWLKDRNKVL